MEPTGMASFERQKRGTGRVTVAAVMWAGRHWPVRIWELRKLLVGRDNGFLRLLY